MSDPHNILLFLSYLGTAAALALGGAIFMASVSMVLGMLNAACLG